jgi:hypothetical protein
MNVLPYAIPAALARRMPALLPNRVGVDSALLSNIGHVSGLPAEVGDAGAIREFWGTPPAYPGMDAAFSVTTFGSRLLVGLRYTRGAFDPATAREFALLFRDTLLGRDGDRPRAGRFSQPAPAEASGRSIAPSEA